MSAAQPTQPHRGRGRPRRQAGLADVVDQERTPTGTWSDNSKELAARVKQVVGDRTEKGRCLDRKETLRRLVDLAREVLGRAVTGEEQDELECHVFGGSPRPSAIVRTLGTGVVARRTSQPVSVIVRMLMQWRDGLSYRDLLRFKSGGEPALSMLKQEGKLVPAPPAPPALILKYDEHRQPVCDAAGEPILWVADDHGQPGRRWDGAPLEPRPVMHRQPAVQEFVFAGGPPK